MRFGWRFFFPSLYRKIKDQNPSISEEFTKTFLKWPRDRLETTWHQCWSFRAEKRSAQASTHPLSPAFVCLVLWEFWLRLNEIHEVRKFAPFEGFFLFLLLLLLFFRHLKITLDSGQPMLKTDHPSVWGGIKQFEHFQRGLYFSDNRPLALRGHVTNNFP